MTETDRSTHQSSLPVPGDHVTLLGEVLAPEMLRHVIFRSTLLRRGAERRASDLPLAPSRSRESDAPALEPALTSFYDGLFDRFGLRADRYRTSVLRRRGHACLRAVGARDPARARALVGGDPTAAERALQAVSIGVTGFFRDTAVFTALEAPLRELARARPEGLRVLSVGCSDGRELYSIAMLLETLGIPARALHGLDCRPQAVREAAAGMYRASDMETIPRAMREAFFGVASASGNDWLQVSAALRARCEWHVGDAFSLAPPPRYDVVLCRNLLIYLTTDAASALWERLCTVMAPDGILVVGKAERAPSRTRLRRARQCIYRGPECDA